MTTIKIKGADELLLKLARIEKLIPVTLALRAAAYTLKGKLATYPTQRRITRASVYGAPFQSDRQRRWFFAALRSGELDLPYHRGEDLHSERFGQSWTVKAEDGGLTQIVGNDTSYGPYVMGDQQSLFMQAMGWKKADDIADKEVPGIVDQVSRAIDDELNS